MFECKRSDKSGLVYLALFPSKIAKFIRIPIMYKKIGQRSQSTAFTVQRSAVG